MAAAVDAERALTPEGFTEVLREQLEHRLHRRPDPLHSSGLAARRSSRLGEILQMGPSGLVELERTGKAIKHRRRR